MAASVFETYEQQLGVLTADITADRSKITIANDSVEKNNLVKQAEKHVNEAKELLEQMELEVRQMQSSDRHKYQTRLRSYQTEMVRLENDLKQAKRETTVGNRLMANETETRDELFGSGDNDDADSVDQRTRLLDNTERLERSGRRLDAGYRVVIETEQIGAGILQNLHSQRETITRARDRLRETDDDLGKSSRILTAMMRRILQNRVTLYAVIGFMFIIVVLTIYLASSSS